jgi:hypothetical protein
MATKYDRPTLNVASKGLQVQKVVKQLSSYIFVASPVPVGVGSITAPVAECGRSGPANTMTDILQFNITIMFRVWT